MSFGEGLTTGAVDVADPTFAICAGAIVLIVALLFAAPAIATALHFWRADGVVGRLFWQVVTALERFRSRRS